MLSLAAMPAMCSEIARSEYRLNLEQPSLLRLPGKDAAPAAPAGGAQADVPEPPALSGRPYADLIRSAAKDASLDPALVHTVISVESGYNSAARSPKGAIGLMQVLPETAQRYGVRDPARSPEANLRAGTRYLSDLMQMFEGRLDLVLAAYNAGENAVLRYSQHIPPFSETRRYVPAVLAKYRAWREPPVLLPEPVAAGPQRIVYLGGTLLDPDSVKGGRPLAFVTGTASNAD